MPIIIYFVHLVLNKNSLMLTTAGSQGRKLVWVRGYHLEATNKKPTSELKGKLQSK